jgi:hypothetical protein
MYKLGVFIIIICSIGIGIAPGLIYHYFLPLIILSIGVIIVWCTNKTFKFKILWTLFPLLVIPLLLAICIKLDTLPKEVFLIPEDYRGTVNIIYGQKCGAKLNVENDTITYNIPKDGILIISNEYKSGYIDHTYYFVDKEGNKKLIDKMDVRDFNEEYTTEKNPHEPPRNKLGIFNWGRIGGYENSKNESCTFQEFNVSTYEDLEEKYGVIYVTKFDSIRENRIKNCK